MYAKCPVGSMAMDDVADGNAMGLPATAVRAPVVESIVKA
jgi:hypothetical protein